MQKQVLNNDPKPRVLVVENDLRTAVIHKQNLERWGYQPILADGIGEALLIDAQRRAYDQACHIALIDMHLLDDHDDNDKSGLDLVTKLKPTLSIILSGAGNDRKTTLEAIRKEAFDFVGKEEPLARLQESLANAAKAMCCEPRGPTVNIAETLVTQIMNSLAAGKPEQVRDTLKSLFPEANEISVELIAGSARTPSVNLRRESYVLKVQPDNLQPFAVKLASIERIDREFENYTNYIKHRLGHNCYAKIVGFARRWQIGGISYEFFGEGLDTFTLFSQYYVQRPAKEICTTITHLFEHVWGDHVSQQRKSSERSLFNQFSARWNRQKWLERLDGYIHMLETESHDDELIGHFLDPVVWVRKRTGDFGRTAQLGEDVTTRLGQLMEAVGHGDLQGDNFFVNNRQQAWVIDYERTGYGPVIQDFVLLEFDIWARLVDITDRRYLLELLCRMAAQKVPPLLKGDNGTSTNEEIKKAYRVIMRIRQLAGRLVTDPRIYLWGVLLNAVFRIVLLEEKIRLAQTTEAYKRLFQEREQTMLVGAVLCRRLDDWEKTWPPPEWALPSHTDERNPAITNRSMLNLPSKFYSLPLRQRIDRPFKLRKNCVLLCRRWRQEKAKLALDLSIGARFG